MSQSEPSAAKELDKAGELHSLTTLPAVTGSWIVVDQLTGHETTFETGEEAYLYAIEKQGELHPKYRRYYVKHQCQEF